MREAQREDRRLDLQEAREARASRAAQAAVGKVDDVPATERVGATPPADDSR